MKYFTSIIAVCVFISVGSYARAQTQATNPVLAAAGFKIKAPKAGGTGAYGGNRRVYGPAAGYSGVEGTFSMPLGLSLGSEYEADSAEHGGDGKPSNPGKNPFENKPSFYFGADGHNFNLEAGYQYEGLYKNGLDAGWSTYSSVTLTYPLPSGKSETVGSWYQSTASANRQAQVAGRTLPSKLIINEEGEVEIELSDFPEPENANGDTPNIYPAITRPDGQVPKTSIKVRRVIAMTQKTGVKGDSADGAYVRGVKFDEGYVWNWPVNGANATKTAWSTGMAPGHEYIPESYNIGFETQGPSGGRLFVVDSSAPWNRLASGEKRPDTPLPTGANHTRYFKESVDINLLAKPGKVDTLPKKTAKK